jgi:hypothetical protein
MNKITVNLLRIIVIASLLMLTACNVPATGAQPATVDSKAVAGTVSVIQTESVKQALSQLTEAAKLTPQATNTEVPSATPQASPTTAPTDTQVPPTTAPTLVPTTKPIATSTPVPTLTKVVIVAPTSTQGQSEYQCTVTSLSPALGYKIGNGGDFDLNVTFKNTGTKTWSASDIDFRYLSGASFQESVDAVDLSKDIAPGETVSFVVDMLAKTGTGTQTATWGLTRSNSVFCYVGIRLYVQ